MVESEGSPQKEKSGASVASAKAVIAVDPWAVGMRRLRRKLEHLGIRNVGLLEQDAATIDLPDASVDVVVSNLGINNSRTLTRCCVRASAS